MDKQPNIQDVTDAFQRQHDYDMAEIEIPSMICDLLNVYIDMEILTWRRYDHYLWDNVIDLLPGDEWVRLNFWNYGPLPTSIDPYIMYIAHEIYDDYVEYYHDRSLICMICSAVESRAI